MHDPPEDILKQISLLAWIPLREVREYQTKLEEQLKSQIKSEQRLQWKQAPYIATTQNRHSKLCVVKKGFQQLQPCQSTSYVP